MGERVEVQTVERGCRPFQYLREVENAGYPVLLESSLHNTDFGRYSILCWDPVKVLTCRGSSVEVENMQTGASRKEDGAPFSVLSKEFLPHRIELPDSFHLPFAGGAVGYFSYDLRHQIESLPRSCEYDLAVPEFTLCFYDRALVFDHHRNVTEFVGPAGCDPPDFKLEDTARDKAGAVAETGRLPAIEGVVLESSFKPGEYPRAVQKVIDYIAAGDIFQANLSQRFEGFCPAEGIELYERLRMVNPAPFSAYMKYPDIEVVSSSPERFLLVEGDRVTTRPIKGTRARIAGDDVFNKRMEEELLNSEKDHAELAMIVDLERNDLGRVCSYGSVRVKEHAVLETYPTVFHLVSTVEGRLFREQYDEFSLVRATFPGGSITGAPKIRAMEIIEEIEPYARNIYTGSIGYFSFHGRADLNIVIRTLMKAGGRIYMHFGGGIVADSDPQMEFQETLDKGKALFQAAGAENFEEIMGMAYP
ncbi:MAG: aminodeoxychorismate synthase component I [Planctomycetes bacterium]|nr:aminodeoxychorismate synthase component I [Planctomycetota bacterium]